MPVPEDQRLKFFVYIVESPSPVDVYFGRGEGQMLTQAIGLNRIPAVARVTISHEAFEAALRIGIAEAMQVNPGLVPILHLSAHGDKEGIQLSSGEHVTWQDLRELLKPINKALGGILLVCMSCCEGYSGIRMAMYPHDPDAPYLALIGNTYSPTWADTAVGYASFYHLLAKGEYVTDAVEAMRQASGNPHFMVEASEVSKKAYLDYVASLNTGAAQQLLQEAVAAQPVPDLAKQRTFARDV